VQSSPVSGGNDQGDARAPPPNDDEEKGAEEIRADGTPFAEATYQQGLEAFRTLKAGQLLSYDIYSAMYLTASRPLARFIAFFASQADHDTPISPECVGSFFRHHWLFGDPILLSFPWDLLANILWRHAYLAQKWADFAAISLQWMALATSEAGAENPIPVHWDIVGTHAANYGIETLLQQLRMYDTEEKDQFSNESNSSNHDDDDEETQIQSMVSD
jgi:hypothetical protein